MPSQTKTERNPALGLIEKTYLGLIVVILGGIVLHAPFSVYFGTLLPDYNLVFKSWKEILMGLALILMLAIVTKRRLWRELARDKLMWLVAAFAGLHLLLMPLFYQGAGPTLAGLLIDLRYLLFFVLVYVLMKIAPAYRKLLLIVAVAGAGLVVVFGVAQTFLLPPDILSYLGYSRDTIVPYLTVDQNPDYIRINSTLRGPNPLGAYMIIILAGVAAVLVRNRDWVRTTWRRLGLIALTAGSLVVLWVSYSRSAKLGAVAAVAMVAVAAYGLKLSKWIWLALVGLMVALVATLYMLRDTSFVANVILHDDPELGAVETSNDGHIKSLIQGTERMIVQPFGAGIGSTGSATIYDGGGHFVIENQYFYIAHEVGWLGLGLFLAIFGLVMWRLWLRRNDWLALAAFSSGVGLALVGVLLPVWADETVAIIWWGLAAVVLVTSRRKNG